jgi:hypothetical protein
MLIYIEMILQNFISYYFTIEIFKHVITKFSDLLHFLDSWVVYREEKGIPLVGQNALHQVVGNYD